MTQVDQRHVAIDMLLTEVEQMDEQMFQPPVAPIKDDKVVGEAQVYTQKLWATAQWYSRRAEELTVEARYSTPKEMKQMQPQVFEACIKRDLLHALAFFCARSDANHWKHNIGVRRGWKIVEPGAQSHEGFMRKIQDMFRGEGENDPDSE